MKTGTNIRKRADGRYEARYQKGRNADNRIIYGYCYGKTYEEAESKRRAVLDGLSLESFQPSQVRQMNLLILGAGGQGFVVKEVAESIGIFNKIDFLDDDSANPHAIGNCDDCARFIKQYPIAIPSVGNNVLRRKWIWMLASAGFIIPSLIASSATVSPSAVIGYGTLIEPKVIIGANAKIGIGCLIGAGAIVERDALVADYTHIKCGETVRK